MTQFELFVYAADIFWLIFWLTLATTSKSTIKSWRHGRLLERIRIVLSYTALLLFVIYYIHLIATGYPIGANSVYIQYTYLLVGSIVSACAVLLNVVPPRRWYIAAISVYPLVGFFGLFSTRSQSRFECVAFSIFYACVLTAKVAKRINLRRT